MKLNDDEELDELVSGEDEKQEMGVNEEDLRLEDIDLKDAIKQIMESEDDGAKDVFDLRIGKFLREKIEVGLLGKTVK